MNLAVDLKFTKDEFLRWVQEQDYRYELTNGKAVMMHGGTSGHSSVYADFTITLANRIDRSAWRIHTSDFAVEIGDGIRYPDVIIETGGRDRNRLSTDSPAFIAEVLSPSSLALDLNVKAKEYMSLPSLLAYLVAAQDEARVWLWERGENGLFPKEPVEIHGKDKAITLACFDVSVPMAEIYLSLP